MKKKILIISGGISKERVISIATGKQVSVRDFIEITAKKLGWGKASSKPIYWQGKGLNEVGYLKDGLRKEIIIKIDKNYFRPLEVDTLLGNSRKARKNLNWKPCRLRGLICRDPAVAYSKMSALPKRSQITKVLFTEVYLKQL